MASRNLTIDTLRGIACILLVAYHVVGSDKSSGLQISSGVYRDLNDLLAYVRMPLFTFLSGIVYAYRPFNDQFFRFMKGKVRRLLLPMLVVGTGFALLQAVAPGAHNVVKDWSLIHIIPVAHFWFVEAIFVIFLLMTVLEHFKLFASFLNFTLIFVTSILLYLKAPYVPYFGINGAIYLLPFFLMGMSLQRYNLIKRLNLTPKVGILFVSLIVITLALMYFGILPEYAHKSIPGLAIALIPCVGLLLLGMESKLLASLGQYSYSVYIYHVFFTAGCRIILEKMGLNEIFLIFLASLCMGLVGPVIVERLFDKSSLCRVLLLGKKPLVKTNSQSANAGMKVV